MMALARHNVLGLLGINLMTPIMVIHQFDRDALLWLGAVAVVIGSVLIVVQFGFQWHLWREDPTFTAPRDIRGRNFALVAHGIAMLSYVALLSFMGDHLGWSLKQAGTIGILLSLFVFFAAACRDWAVEAFKPTGSPAVRA